MNPLAERQVWIRVAGQVEPVGVGEDRIVPPATAPAGGPRVQSGIAAAPAARAEVRAVGSDSSTLRVGVNRQWSNGWAARMGGTVASSAAPPETVTPLLPEQDRWTFNMGAGVPLSKRWTMDAAFAHVGVWGSRGRIGERADRTSTAASLNTGWYTLNANILSLSIKATY